MDMEIFALFNKSKCGYYRKTNALKFINCLRGMMKEIGYSLVKTQKGINEIINGRYYERTHMIYSIK